MNTAQLPHAETPLALRQLFDLRGRRALVTGGSRGVGYMLARALLSAGAEVFICARKDGEVRAAARTLGAIGPCTPLVADLSDAAALAGLRDGLARHADRLDILVNNAGTTYAAPLASFPRERFDHVLRLNLSAPFELARLLLPMLRAAARQDHPARIVNISSIDGLRVPAWPSYPYGASKAALLSLTRHMAHDLASEHITVNAIAPGVFESRMTGFLFDDSHPAHEPLPTFPLGNRPGSPEDIGAAIVYLCSAAGNYLTGITLPVSGGLGCAF